MNDLRHTLKFYRNLSFPLLGSVQKKLLLKSVNLQDFLWPSLSCFLQAGIHTSQFLFMDVRYAYLELVYDMKFVLLTVNYIVF